MSNRHTLPSLLLGLGLLAQGALAQTPASLPQFITPPTDQNQQVKGVAMDGAGNLTFIWESSFLDVPFRFRSQAYSRRFTSFDTPASPPMLLDPARFDGSAVEVVANHRGDVLIMRTRLSPRALLQTVVRRTSPVLPARTIILSEDVGGGGEDVAVDDEGNFVILRSDYLPLEARRRVFGQRYNANGTKRGPEFNVATSEDEDQHDPSVAMNPVTGEFVVVWEVRDTSGRAAGVKGQRFGFFTGRQGSEFTVYEIPEAERNDGLIRLTPDVARAVNGGFVVVWKTESGATDVLAQRFTVDGAAVGPRIVVHDDPGIPDGGPRIAMSRVGDFVVSWDDNGTSPVWFRLFHRDGRPAGPIRERERVASPYVGGSRVAYGGNGTFALAWTNFNDEGPENTISYQRFSASPGDEICLFRNGHFRCDTGRTEGAPEVDHVFAIRGGTPLLGDVDGDGRDDFCIFRNDRFDCDSGHDNGAAETTITFGQPGDTPLLGDVDGDGRDEACVFRANQLLCDTAHDGGAAELTLALTGEPTDRAALLGDVDGDGRDEICLAGPTAVRCDTGHDGGAAEYVRVALGINERPVLGDIDGNGRDDICGVSANSVFRCDVVQTGDPLEVILILSGPGRPLIGNIDGL